MSSAMHQSVFVAFIIERPLQLMISLAIISQIKIDKSKIEILVVNEFANAKDVSENIYSVLGIKSILFETYRDAFIFSVRQKYDRLFIHWDVGFRTQFRLGLLKLNNPRLMLSVFEEGVGTYKDSIYSGIRESILRLIGFPIKVGTSRFTNDVYVYERDRYLENSRSQTREVHQISKKLHESVLDEMPIYLNIFNGHCLRSIKKMHDSCIIYLTGWVFKEEKARELFKENCQNIIKLHPHCTATSNIPGVFNVPSGIPAEILITICSNIFSKVVVYHEGSSTEMYFRAENVFFRSIF
jgi:hypothetical protein